jgi:hypothetical protein
VTFASSLRTPHKKIFFPVIMVTASFLPFHSYAQYAPPPMFEDALSNSARPSPPSGYIVPPIQSAPPPVQQVQPARPAVLEPRISRDPDKNPQPSYQPYIPPAPSGMKPIVEKQKQSAPKKVVRTPAPPVVPAKKPTPPTTLGAENPVSSPRTILPKPVIDTSTVDGPMDLPPDAQMTDPIISRVPVYSPEVIPSPADKPTAITPPAPTKAPTPRGPNAPMPAAKVTSKGVVTGPKTMPAVPTTAVQQVETFDDSALANEPTIMERHLNATNKKKAESAKKKADATLTPVVAPPSKHEDDKTSNKSLVADMPSDPAPVINFDDAKPQVMKKILPYQAGQIDLPKDDMNIIAQGVQQQLKSKPDWRVQIRSFATPQGESLSSDRRIALSRALSIRTALVRAGINPSVIDMRADGIQSAESLGSDRVDLYLYNPAEPMETP